MSAFTSISGNLTRDPELRKVGDQNVASFTVAVNTACKDQSGEYITNFYDCSWFGKRGESFVAYAQKGTGVIVHGSVAMVGYKSKTGEDRTSLRVNVSDVEITARGKGSHKPADQDAAPATKPASTPTADSMPF